MPHLNLNHKIKLDQKTITSANLCDRFDQEDLDRIGGWVLENYLRDKNSRYRWEQRTESAMNLAMQLQEAKTFPWPDCSNVAFPLVTIAAMQFHARAYPAIISGDRVVQCKVVGDDTTGVAKARADKIGKHMSWQRLEQDESWEEDQDRAMLNVSIVGVGFKKSYYNASLGYSVSEFVPAKNLVVNYFAKSIDTALIKTHIIPMYKNDIYERCMRGSFVDVRNDAWFTTGGVETAPDYQDVQKDNRQGTDPPKEPSDEVPFQILEQHCALDLDGDGYAEPYIITIEETSGKTLRIVTRFDRIEDIEFNDKKEVIRITSTEYFTKMPFIPSPDGGIYDVGFGLLLGPLNDSVNSILNQLIDAATLANTAGGFLGRGAKIKGGVYQFEPFGWNRVDSSGDDLRKNIMPLPVREPSGVMFSLLNLLIEYTSRISGSTDMMVGENPGQNTPADTSRTMIEQGQKVYSAIFKRMWRSLKREFQKLFDLNAVYLPASSPFGEGDMIKREDYSGGRVSIVPVADPTITSDVMRFAQAKMLKEASTTTAGYNSDEVEKRYLKALGITDTDAVFPGSASMEPPPPDVKIQVQQMKTQLEMAKLQFQQVQFATTMQETVRLNNAKIAELMAQAAKLTEDAAGAKDKQKIEAFRAAIEAMREQNNQVNAQLDRMVESFNATTQSDGTGAGGAIQGMGATGGNSAVLPVGEVAA